jgi:REP element-mobilizing transposase RayT
MGRSSRRIGHGWQRHFRPLISMHGIIVITETTRHPLGHIVGAFKTMSTKHVNEWRETLGAILWHRNYYEHIIRDDDDLQRIREYIAANPARWSEESEDIPTPPFRTGDA